MRSFSDCNGCMYMYFSCWRRCSQCMQVISLNWVVKRRTSTSDVLIFLSFLFFLVNIVDMVFILGASVC